MTLQFKSVVIGEQMFDIVKIDAWRRLTFIADLQKEFLLPLLRSAEGSEIQSLLQHTPGKEVDIMAVLSGFSNTIDDKTLEKWTRRILSDGMVTCTRPDRQRVKLSFSEINHFFTEPADIIMLIKEAVAFNIEGFTELMKKFTTNADKKTPPIR